MGTPSTDRPAAVQVLVEAGWPIDRTARLFGVSEKTIRRDRVRARRRAGQVCNEARSLRSVLESDG